MKRSGSSQSGARWGLRVVALLALVGLFGVFLGPVLQVGADNVQNDVVAGGNDTITVGGSTTINYRISINNGDGQTGCNVIDGSAAMVTINAPSGVAASPGSLTFTTCGTNQGVAFSSNAAGDYEITVGVSDSGVGTYNTNPAKFTLHVLAPTPTNTAVPPTNTPTNTPVPPTNTPTNTPLPPTNTPTNTPVPNTPPTVSVTGVTDGASYDKGSVPAANCQVSDLEDGKSSFAPTLSVITGPYATDGIGSQTASCSYTDGGGLNDSDSATYSIADPSAPVIGYVLNPASPDGSNGWYKSDVTLTWTVTENESPSSLQKTGCVDQNITTDQSEQTYSCSATSAGGSASQVDVKIKRDATAPVITGSASPAANANGWNNSDATVSFTCSDALSGKDTLTAPITLSSEGSGQSATGTCVDNAGNSASTTVSNINIDKTAPSASGAVTTSPNANGWYNSSVTVHFTCSDSLSGIDLTSVPDDAVLNSDGENQSTSGSCTDLAGNTASATVSGINIDTTKPGISLTSRTAANSNGWNNGNVVVDWSCTDGLSGVVAATDSETVSTEGANQSATGTCEDLAGNTNSETQTGINIDMTKPIVSGSAAPAANSNGWNNSNVTVTFTCADALSGQDTLTDPSTMSSDGSNQSASGTCVDKAGNSASTTVSGINIDKTAPSVSLVGGPSNGASYYFGSVPAAPTCSASDSLSGLDGSCSVSGYSNLVGSHTVTASAKDLAGNTASANASYTVLAWTPKGFYQPVDMGTVLNTVKAGSTVPLKFEVFAGSTELTDPAIVKSLTVAKINMSTSTLTDEIETTATGGTSLRYDSTGGQFIYNWSTKGLLAGQCYQITLTLQDGSTIVAYFKMK